MFLTFLLIILASCTIFLYLQWRKVQNYWSVRNVPFLPNPHIFYGSFTFLRRQNPAIWMRHIYNRETPYLGIWIFWRPVLIINSPKLASDILGRKSSNFRNKLVSCSSRDTASTGLFFAKDPLWSKLRRHLSGAFTPLKLKNVKAFSKCKSLDLVQRISSEINNLGGRDIDVRDVFCDYITDIISATLFGVASESTLTGNSSIKKFINEYEKVSTYERISWYSIFFCPKFAEIFGFTFLPKRLEAFITEVVGTIKSIRKEPSESHEPLKTPQNILEHILQIPNVLNFDSKEAMDKIVLSQFIIFLVGSFETTICTLNFSIYLLAFHPDVQEKMYNKLLEAQEKNDDELNLDSEQVYVDCVIKETLRLFPPLGWLDRTPLEDYKIDDKLTIKAGTPIFINGTGLHMDPEYFPEPNNFIPERFLPNNEAKINPFTYIAFGEGPRSCLGQRFAMILLRNAIVEIIKNYKVEPCPNAPKPLDIEIEKDAALLFPAEKLRVKFFPRK